MWTPLTVAATTVSGVISAALILSFWVRYRRDTVLKRVGWSLLLLVCRDRAEAPIQSASRLVARSGLRFSTLTVAQHAALAWLLGTSYRQQQPAA